jgi:pimeloyl-ACP methyl ester carboxylesterase
MSTTSSSSRTERVEVPVAGGTLNVWRLGDAPPDAPTVLAVHGITGSSRSWVPVARSLKGRATLLTPDIRGRGRSNELPPPYGIASHVADLLAVLDYVGIERAVIAGHSLGAYITARLAADHPGRVAHAVLVDGGIEIPGSEGADPQEFANAFLGPALARLQMTFASRDEYRAWWRAHPALATPEVADEDLDAYADYDLVGERSCISQEAVRADAGELATMADPAHRMTVPATLLVASRGLQDGPNVMQPIERAQEWAAEMPDRRRALLVPDVNHYTITLGAKGAAAVAAEIARITDAV